MTTETDKPCAVCPWTSKDPRDREAIDAPAIRGAMEAGKWFACHHQGGGTCHGARLRHAAHVRAAEKENA